MSQVKDSQLFQSHEWLWKTRERILAQRELLQVRKETDFNWERYEFVAIHVELGELSQLNEMQ